MCPVAALSHTDALMLKGFKGVPDLSDQYDI